MADQKLTATSALTAPLPADIVYVVTDPGGTPLSRKVTLTNLFLNIPATLLSGASATVNLWNTVVTTLNIGGAASVLSIGSASGLTTVNNALTSLSSVGAKPTGTAGIRFDPNAATGNYNLSISPANLTAARRVTMPDVDIVITAAGASLIDDTTAAAQVTTLGLDNTKIAGIAFIIDGGGATIASGLKGYLEIPFSCSINRASMFTDRTASMIVDIWSDTYANFAPTVGDTITGTSPLTIVAGSKIQDTVLGGWTASIAAGNVIAFNVNSCTSAQRATVSLKVTKL